MADDLRGRAGRRRRADVGVDLGEDRGLDRRRRRTTPAPPCGPGRRRRRRRGRAGRAATSYSSFSVVPNIGGSSELIGDRHAGRDQRRAAGAPRATARTGCGRWTSGTPPARYRCSARYAISSGSCAAAMPCPMRSAPRWSSDVPDRLRAGGLPGVRHAVQPGGAGLREVRRELLPRHADLRAAEAEADQPVRAAVAARRRAWRRRAGEAGLAGDVEAPAQLDAEVGLGRAAGVLDRLAERLGRDAGLDRGVRREGQLGVADVLRGQVAGDLVGQRPDVLGGADQVDDARVDLDEVREVGERRSSRASRSGSAGTGVRPSCRAASSATVRGDAEPTWWTCSSALGRPATKVTQREYRGRRSPAL